MKPVALVAAVAVALATTVLPQRGHAAPAPSAVSAGVSLGAGPYIVGGVMLSAVSLMVCAAHVGRVANRELTSREAWTAAVIPFACLFSDR